MYYFLTNPLLFRYGKIFFFFSLQIPDYRNAIIVARNPNSVKRATSYAERLRLGIAVIHGEEKYDDEDKEDDGRNSPPLCRVEYKKIEILPGRYDHFLHLCPLFYGEC